MNCVCDCLRNGSRLPLHGASTPRVKRIFDLLVLSSWQPASIYVRLYPLMEHCHVLKRKNLTPIYRASLLVVDSALFLRGVQWRISVLAVVVSAGTSAHPRIPHRSVFIETTCMQTYYFSQASCFLKAYCSGFVGCCSWKFIKFQRFGLNAQRPKARYLMTYKETAVDCLSPEPQTHPIRIRK